MTKETKLNLLKVFDTLNEIATGRRPPSNPDFHPHGGKGGGGGLYCDICGGSWSSNPSHESGCFVKAMITIMVEARVLPNGLDRDAWINETGEIK